MNPSSTQTTLYTIVVATILVLAITGLIGVIVLLRYKLIIILLIHSMTILFIYLDVDERTKILQKLMNYSLPQQK